MSWCVCEVPSAGQQPCRSGPSVCFCRAHDFPFEFIPLRGVNSGRACHPRRTIPHRTNPCCIGSQCCIASGQRAFRRVWHLVGSWASPRSASAVRHRFVSFQWPSGTTAKCARHDTTAGGRGGQCMCARRNRSQWERRSKMYGGDGADPSGHQPRTDAWRWR